jgi:hypothetical protein
MRSLKRKVKAESEEKKVLALGFLLLAFALKNFSFRPFAFSF